MDETTVTLCSAIVAALVSLLVGFFTYKRNEKEFYSKFISNERLLWVKETRKLVAELLALCDGERLCGEDEQRFFYLKNEIILRLNPVDESNHSKYTKDQKILKILKRKSFAEIKANKETLIENFMMIFKSEWDFTKIEAGRSRKQYLKFKRIAEQIHKEQE